MLRFAAVAGLMLLWTPRPSTLDSRPSIPRVARDRLLDWQTAPPSSPATTDTIQAGDPRIETSRLRPYTIERHLTITRGDSSQPFGSQTESLASTSLHGHAALLGVVTFATPRATTVDSSWLDATTLAPIRMRSTNAERVVDLEFSGQGVRTETTPSRGEASRLDQPLGVRPFEWNMFGLALSAMPLAPGFNAVMPVYSDRFARVVWYQVEVVQETSLVRQSGYHSPMWEVVATPDSAGPSARFWISRTHRFVDQVRVWEPGVSITYAREL